MTPALTLSILGFITIFISIVGFIVAFRQFLFFRRSGEEISKRLGFVFFTDAAIYGATGFFGFLAFFHLPETEWVNGFAIRIPILIMNILASIRLYAHYKKLR